MSKDKELFNLFKRFAEDNYTLKDLEWIREKVEDPYDKDSVERAFRHYWYQNIVSGEDNDREGRFQSGEVFGEYSLKNKSEILIPIFF